MVKIEVERKELLKALKFLKGSFKLRRKYPLKVVCEITVKTGLIELAVPGSFYELKCKTKGVAKATIPFVYLWDYVNELKEHPYIEIEFKGEYMYLDSLTLKVNTTYIEDDKILRTIKLPANYTYIDLIKLTHGTYTTEELEFNELIPKIIHAQKKLKSEFNKLQKSLDLFGISNDEISKLIQDKIGFDLNESIKLK